MRKLKLFWTICALMLLTDASNSWAGTKTVYFKPNSNWKQASAKFGLWMFGGSKSDAFADYFTPVEGVSGVYSVQFDDTYTKMIFVRFNPSSDERRWDAYEDEGHVWNQSSTIDAPAVTGLLYEMKSGWNDPNIDITYYAYYNQSVSLTDGGQYIFRNVGSGRYLAPDNDYSSQASLITASHFNTIHRQKDGIYTIESQVTNGDGQIYYNSGNGYMDSSDAGWMTFRKAADNVYNIYVTDASSTGSSLIGYDGSSAILCRTLNDPASDNAKWQLIPLSDALDGATRNNPADATYLIKDADFAYKSRCLSSWNRTNVDHYGRWDANGEGSYHYQNWNMQNYNGDSFDIYQELTDLPNGLYKVTCQGYYRAGDGGTTDNTPLNALLYANSQTSPLMSINDGASTGSGYTKEVGSTATYVPNDQHDAALVFTTGAYSGNEVYAIVDDGNLKIGVKKTTKADKDWACFDNFRLYYYGAIPAASSSNPVDLTCMMTNAAVSNARGWTNASVNNGQQYTGAPDNTYLDACNWSESTTLNMYQTISSLPKGCYTLKAATRAHASMESSYIYAEHDGSTKSQQEVHKDGSSGGDLGNGWSWTECPFYKADNNAINVGFCLATEGWGYWAGADDFHLYYLGDPYPALSDAITAADEASHTLGFEVGEYAPYENAEILQALETANDIYDAKTATAAEVETATATLTGASWTANAVLKDAIYDGRFANTAVGSVNSGLTGWTTTGTATGESSIFRQVLSADKYEGGKCLYLWPSTIKYGETTGYTMPLTPNSIYKLSYSYAGYQSGTNSPTLTIRNENGTVLNAIETGAAEIYTSSTKNYSIYFLTESSRQNYKFEFTPYANTNTTIGDVSLMRVDALEFADGTVPNYTPGTYPTVKITRSLTANRWATAVYPFALSGVSNIAVLSSYNAETGTLGFTSAAASTANQPFLMRSTAEGGISEINLSNVDVAAPSVTNAVASQASLIGAYTTTTVTNAEKNYVLSNNTIYYVGSKDAIINPYRAYIQIDQPGQARPLSFFIDDEATTHIEGIAPPKNPLSGSVYNLNGQLLRQHAAPMQPLQKGVYIVNGQRIVVK